MIKRFDGLRLWRRYLTARWAVGGAVVALLLTGALASGALYVAHAAPLAGHSGGLQPPRPDPKAEGQWFQMMHVGRSHPAPNARDVALQQAAKLPVSPLSQPAKPVASSTSPYLGQGTWAPLGPQPIDSNYNCTNTADPTSCWSNDTGLNSGRITAMAVNPANNNDLWIGAADGGLWHSTDGGSNWSSVTPAGNSGTLAIGSIAIDPNAGTPYAIYVGTGEGNGNLDAYWGEGIWKSVDGGLNWTQLGYQYFAGMSVDKIAVDPANTQTQTNQKILAAVTFDGWTAPSYGANPATSGGIWESDNGGSTWVQVISDGTSSSPLGGTDVLFDPADPTGNTVYAGVGNIFGAFGTSTSSTPGIWMSTTGPSGKWSQLTATVPYGSNVERVSMSASHGHLYAVVTDGGKATFGDLWNATFDATGHPTHGYIYETSNGGSTWTPIDVAANGAPEMVNDDGESQWWYDSVAAADPTDTNGNTLYVGGVDLWQTTDGGITWTNLTNAYLSATTPYAQVHPDQHAFTFFAPNATHPGYFYLGNDGGVWSGTGGTGTAAFTNLNGGGLNITQFYGGSIGEVGSDSQLYGGAQDNGEDALPNGASTPAQWNQMLGGDGGYTAVDYTNNAIVYGEFPNGYVYKTTNGGATWAAAHSGINLSDPVNFIMPLVMSPSNHNELLAGTDRVYRTTNGASTWSAISPQFTDPSHHYYSTISTIAVAPSNDKYIYAGEYYGRVYVSTNGGSSWYTSTYYSSPLCANSPVTSVAVDPTNPSVAYATCGGFNGTQSWHVLQTTDAGLIWSDISLGLPDIPFESVVVNPHNPHMIMVGSDAGVYVTVLTPNTSIAWYRLGGGTGGTSVPNVAVDQIFMDHAGTRLFVATHGRGMWEMAFPDLTATPAAVYATTTPGVSPPSQTFAIASDGFGTLNWTLFAPSSLPSWLSLSDSQGVIHGGDSRSVAPGTSDTITATFNIPSTDPAKTYNTTLVFSDPNAVNQQISVPVTVVAANVSKTWYFAEGHTGGSFTEFLTLANPNAVAANVQVTYYLGSGSPVVKSYVVSPNARHTLDVNSEIGAGQNVSLVVTSDQPVVAERPMYFTYTGLAGYTIPGGSDVLGATALTTNFDFGYLDTSAGHATWLTILNQNASDMTVSIRYFNASGHEFDRTHTVAANSRGTVYVNAEPQLPAGSYSALVSLSEPGLVERPLYLKDSTTGYTGSADVVGVASPASAWYFAEGYSSASFSERYIVSNPNPSATAAVTLTYLNSDGSVVGDSATIAPGAQHVFITSALLGSGGVNNSAVVRAVDQADGTTPLAVLAERFMSFKYGGTIPGASDVLGATTPTQLYYFAEGYTGGQFSEYLTIENPSPGTTAQVRVTFLPQTGAAPTVRWFTVGPDSRFTLNTASVMPGQSFSMQVLSDVPIVAERPMYFIYAGTQTGGSDVVGYQP